MAFYYPKSQVKTNLYTNGGELMVSSTKEDYKGYYHAVSSGKKYAGKAPNNRSSILLIPLIPLDEPLLTSETTPQAIAFKPNFDSADPMLSENSLIMNDNYQNLTSSKKLALTRFLPVSCYSLPTEKELKAGSYFRYFVKRTNEYKYIEISKEDYKKFQSKDPTVAFELYELVELPWNLSKNSLSNQRIVIDIQEQLQWLGFISYFNQDFGSPSPKPSSNSNIRTYSSNNRGSSGGSGASSSGGGSGY